MSMH